VLFVLFILFYFIFESQPDIICQDNEVSWGVDQKRMQWAADDLIKGRPALSRWHPDYAAEFQEFLKK
jgi:hypothetical protein